MHNFQLFCRFRPALLKTVPCVHYSELAELPERRLSRQPVLAVGIVWLCTRSLGTWNVASTMATPQSGRAANPGGSVVFTSPDRNRLAHPPHSCVPSCALSLSRSTILKVLATCGCVQALPHCVKSCFEFLGTIMLTLFGFLSFVWLGVGISISVRILRSPGIAWSVATVALQRSVDTDILLYISKDINTM